MDVGFRYAVRWSLRGARTWVAAGAAVLATWLASRDHRTGWTIVVGIATGTFALLAIWVAYADAHPDRAARLAAREQARVEAILARYDRERAARERPAHHDGDPSYTP